MKTLIQISDCHIDDTPIVMGINTQQNLSLIIDDILGREIDGLLITGDLAHNGTLGSYRFISKQLIKLDADIVVLPGNHDDTDNLITEFENNLVRELRFGDWGVVSAYSKQNNQISGLLSDEELQIIDDTLRLSKAKYNIVIIHHPPVPMCSEWDDSLSLQNMDDFMEVVDRNKNIKAILWGHAHQSSEFEHNNIKLISCPSTALQFNDDKGVGFNQYSLHNNGKFEYRTRWL
ncbi:MAG: metallophosphoesterase [Candidatus Thioglobus sp.]|jgi:Icc protein